MGGIGAPEIILVVVGIVVLFGAKRLPEIARSVGKAKGEFKKGLDEGDAKAQGTQGNPDLP
jgi:sec-independent protein translocase protein TatA